ncbi:MAG: hypothetical protein ACOYJ2_02045 [Rickettsiales bacterium]
MPIANAISLGSSSQSLLDKPICPDIIALAFEAAEGLVSAGCSVALGGFKGTINAITHSGDALDAVESGVDKFANWVGGLGGRSVDAPSQGLSVVEPVQTTVYQFANVKEAALMEFKAEEFFAPGFFEQKRARESDFGLMSA